MLQTLVLCSASFERTYYRMWPGDYETWPGLVHDCIHPRHNLILPCPSITKPCLAQNNGVLCYFFAQKFRESRNFTLSGRGNAHRKRRLQLGLADWGFEVLDDELYGKVDIRLTEPMTEEEENELWEWIHGQNSDGLGEGYEQQEIPTDRGNLYVSFWDSGTGYFIKDSEEMDEYLGHSGLQFGGM